MIAWEPDHADTPRLDTRGEACPIPIIEIARIIDDIDVGTSLHLLSDDPAARTDIAVWCRMRRHRLLAADRHDDGWWTFEVERGV